MQPINNRKTGKYDPVSTDLIFFFLIYKTKAWIVENINGDMWLQLLYVYENRTGLLLKLMC